MFTATHAIDSTNTYTTYGYVWTSCISFFSPAAPGAHPSTFRATLGSYSPDFIYMSECYLVRGSGVEMNMP